MSRPDSEAAAIDWSQETLSALVDHIETMHHERLREEFPRLALLARSAVEAEGNRRPELAEVRSVLAGLTAELEQHMHKEEMILFPAVRALDQGRMPNFPPQAIGGPIQVMLHEHDDADRDLKRLHELTGGYVVPEEAPALLRSLYDGLAWLEKDLEEHIREENDILFPRTLELARAAI